ncbi:MAG: phytoene/squalene synthase family protein [Ignavibacteria bacterium]
MRRSIEENISRQSGSSFYYTFLFLPREKRKAMHIIYAFCRITDDIADSPDESDEEKLLKLEEWKDELSKALNNYSKFNLLNSLSKVIKEFNMSVLPFFDLIEGVRMDLTKQRYSTFEELKIYCYLVASTIGLMSIELFGFKNTASREYAYYLGIAMQLTNIIRDIKIDAEQNRIYLPQEDLVKYNYSEKELMESTYNEAFINMMKFEVERAEYYYQRAEEFFHPDDYKVLAMGRAMHEIYYNVLKKIKKNNFNVFNKNNNLSKVNRILITLKNYFKYQVFSR